MFIVYAGDDLIFITLSILEKELVNNMKGWGYEVDEFERSEYNDKEVIIKAGLSIL